MKIVINTCHGGFGLSTEAKAWMAERGKIGFSLYEIPRDDPILVECVETLGCAANGSYSELKVVQIPSDVEWTIEDYDGEEWVAEKHRTWQ